MTHPNTFRAPDSYVDNRGPSVFRIQVSMTQSEIAIIRKAQQPDESATACIRRLALDRARGVA